MKYSFYECEEMLKECKTCSFFFSCLIACRSIMQVQYLDTSGWGMNCSALFHEVWISNFIKL